LNVSMDTYRVTVKIKAESRTKAEKEICMRVPQGIICNVRKDNGKIK